MNGEVLSALAVTVKVSLCAAAAVFVPGIALGWFLARKGFPAKSLVETAVALPLVLPPTAVGYALLRLLARDGPLGARSLGFDLDILFTWRGAALAAAAMSLPLVARTARVAFESVDPRLESMARTLGLGPLETFARITVPLARRGLLAAGLMGFSRALGEFGATIIVAGNIPGETRTLALALFQSIASGRSDQATAILAVAVLLAFAAMWTVEMLLRGTRGER